MVTGGTYARLIPCQRHRFDIPEDVAYLNCAYISALMDSVVAAGEAGAKRKAHPWTIAPKDFFAEAARARELFAGLIGAEGRDIAIVPAASYGIATAAQNFPVRAGQRILVLGEQFPSNVYAWRGLARRTGAEVVTVARPANDDWTSAILAVLDERVAVAAVEPLHWTDGALVDLEAVGARARAVGAALVVDATQSLGALPFDVRRIRPDFMVAATYKWLLGPYGGGFLYVAPHRQDGRPLEEHWIARKNSVNFSTLVDYRDEYESGAVRYDVGERLNFHLLPMAIAALEQIHEWGVDSIQATLRAMTDRLAARLEPLGLGMIARERRAGHYLGLRFRGGVPDGLADRLAAAKVYVSVRGRDFMRVSPHLWVSAADEDRFVEILRAEL
jgi:selenocysteine lyase/cysteine desulfurase